MALATIADVVPLVDENRTLVRRGLRALAGTAKPGLRALMSVARVDPGKLTERSVAFGLAPRLNAAGRLHRADAGLELILTDDPLRAAQVAEELNRANHERRAVETRIRYEAEAQIAALDPAHSRPAYVLAGEDWHAGVIGIVASRLVEQHRRPVVLIALSGDTGKGSGRSIDAFDLLAGLTACGGHLARFGGHRAAAGLEIERARLEEFAAAFSAHTERVLAPGDAAPLERVDAVVQCDRLDMSLAEELLALAPFGRGNPGVSLLVEDARFRDLRPMGEGKHLRFTVESTVAVVARRRGSRSQRAGARGRLRRRRPPARRRGGAGRSHLHAGDQRVERRQRTPPAATPGAGGRAGAPGSRRSGRICGGAGIGGPPRRPRRSRSRRRRRPRPSRTGSSCCSRELSWTSGGV